MPQHGVNRTRNVRPACVPSLSILEKTCVKLRSHEWQDCVVASLTRPTQGCRSKSIRVLERSNFLGLISGNWI